MDHLALSAAQHGAVSVPQLRTGGMSYGQIKHLVRSREYERSTAIVLIRTGSAATDARDAMEAVLDAGLDAALSHWSAAAWWGVPGFRLRPFHVTRARKRSATPSRLSTIHEPRCFPAHHRTVLRGVPIVLPARIPFEIAGRDPAGARRFLDRGWARGLLGHQSSMGMLDELAERGRRGITLMRELLGERGPDYRPNDTGVEDRMYELCRRVGLEVTRQRDLSGPEEWLGRVDLLVVGTTVVLEVDSALYHEALIDQAADAARRAALTAAGYEVHSFSDHDIFYETHSTMERLRLIRRSLRSGR
jgi:very-short-patch-repair endonuclease